MPAHRERLGRRLVVASGQKQQIAGLMAVECVDRRRLDIANHRRARLSYVENSINQPGHREGQNRIHVVPELEQAQDALRPAVTLRKAVAKAVEKRVEIVVVNDEYPASRMPLVVMLQVPGELQP